jgi:hypothetical protein
MSNRRQFLASIAAATGAVALAPRTRGDTNESARSLVPGKLSGVPNYWCTWACQNYLYGQGATELDVKSLEGADGAIQAQKALNERVLLGPQGWSKTFHSRVRDELYLLLDDGWQEGNTASFLLDRAKFPGFPGAPQERLRALNAAVKADGWRALALWCRDTPGGADDQEHVRWSKFADIPYWKVDGGDTAGSLVRARLTENAKLTLEHMYGESSLSGDWRQDGRFGPQPWGSPRVQILRGTDVYRTYDATAVLGIPTTLDRAGEMLYGAAGHPEAKALLNVEDEVYVAAVLGCTMGVMRHPLRGLRPGPDADVFLPAPRQIKRRMDEVVRAIRWQRIGAPYAAGSGAMTLDAHILTDEWHFRPGETFDQTVVNNRAKQAAPARMARNMELPMVSAEGDPPYVACARFPNGAAAIGAFERVSIERGALQPRAHVRWMMGDTSGPYGVFGQFASLTLAFNRPLKRGKILAQDLAGDAPVDITAEVKQSRAELTLPGELIDRLGRASATAGDLSMPGLVLVV